MATLLQIYDIRYDGGLKKRVIASIAKMAMYIITTESVGTTNHAERVIWAMDALTNTPQAAEKMMWAIAQNPTISAAFFTDPDAPDSTNVTDTDIDYVVNVSVDPIALNM